MKKLFLFLLLLTFTLHAEEIKPKVAVMEIFDKTMKFKAQDLENATEIFRGYLTESGKFIIIDKSRQAEKIKEVIRTEQKESYKECYDKNCQIPLGQALSADHIIKTTITSLGGSCSLSTEMIDLSKEASVGGGIVQFDCSIDGLANTLKEIAEKISGKIKETGEEPSAATKEYTRPYKYYAFTSLGLSILSLGAGLFFNSKQADNTKIAEDDNYSYSKRKSAYDESEKYYKFRNVSYIASGVFLAAGAGLFLITEEKNPTAIIYLEKNESGLFAQLKFSY